MSYVQEVKNPLFSWKTLMWLMKGGKARYFCLPCTKGIPQERDLVEKGNWSTCCMHSMPVNVNSGSAERLSKELGMNIQLVTLEVRRKEVPPKFTVVTTQ